MRLLPCGTSHPLPDLALGLQVGRVCLESPKVLGSVVDLGGVEEERHGVDDQCQRNTQGRGREGYGGAGVGAKLRTPMGPTRGIRLPCPLAPWAWGAAIMRFILTQAWEPMQAPAPFVCTNCVLAV